MILRGSPSEEHDSFSCLMNVIVTTHVDHPESVAKRMQLRNTLMFLHGFIASKTTKSVVFVVLLHLNVSYGCRHYETGYVLDLVGSKSWRTNKLSTEGNHVLVKQQGVDRMRWSCQYIILVWATCDRKACKVMADPFFGQPRLSYFESADYKKSETAYNQAHLDSCWTVASLDDLCLPICFFPKEEVRFWDVCTYLLTSD